MGRGGDPLAAGQPACHDPGSTPHHRLRRPLGAGTRSSAFPAWLSRESRMTGLKPSRYIANFDSEAAMLRALSGYLHNHDFPMTGAVPPSIEPLMKPLVATVNTLPRRVREEVYTWSGLSEAVAPRKLNQVRAEDVSRWVVSHYPQRRYPAAVIGSSNGALVHLYCALGIPWLPQTFLIPVRRSGVHPDEPAEEIEWGREPARALLAANPELRLHHMFDPNQDRLMARRMAYFRIKRLQLGRTYRSEE